MLRFAIFIVWLSILGGCANVETLATLKPGVSTREEAIAKAGKPQYVWNNDDGTQTLEFTSEPDDGNNCFQVTVKPNGSVSKVQQAITDDNMARIHAGMTKEQVRRILCAPRAISHFPLSGEDVWDWNAPQDPILGTLLIFNVHFKQDTVARTSTTRINRDDCGMIGDIC
ncbi:MAG TPA: hypothetical protein VFW00_02155 [Rhodocyclaceae bacterium]|nr:hypothetical protein [Rhodocyclaceae bacterium]